MFELSDTQHLSKPDGIVLEKFKSQLTQDENGCRERCDMAIYINF